MKYKLWGGIVILVGVIIFAISIFFMYQYHKVAASPQNVPEKFFGAYEEAQDYENANWKVTVRPDKTSTSDAKIVFIQDKNNARSNIEGIIYVITKTDHFDEKIHNYTTRRLTK